MQGYQIVIVILGAVLVGAMLPVLFQLYATLREVRSNIERLGPKVDRTLTEVQEVSQRLNRTGASVEQGVEQVKSVVSTAGEIGRLVQQIKGSVRTAAAVGGAVGPAIVAAIRAFGPHPGASNGRPTEAATTEDRPGEANVPESPGAGQTGAHGPSDARSGGDTA